MANLVSYLLATKTGSIESDKQATYPLQFDLILYQTKLIMYGLTNMLFPQHPSDKSKPLLL